jgi:hypothetical protein
LGIEDAVCALDFDIAAAACLQQWKDEREKARLEALAGKSGDDPLAYGDPALLVEMIPQHN